MILDGIINSVSKSSISITTTDGDTVSIPRNFGETPAPGTAIKVDMSTGMPVVSSAPPITEIGVNKDYLNFYAIDGENTVPPTEATAAPIEFNGIKAKYGPNVSFGFVDLPVGSKTISANNGNVVFSGDTAVGMAVGCDNKLIMRHKGHMELVTSHLISLQGRTVVVSSFRDNFTVEIDIINSEVSGGKSFEEINKLIEKHKTEINNGA